MGNWTGRWISTPPKKCKCKCEKDGGAETYSKTFDADSLDSLKNDGKTETYMVFHCAECIEKYGKEIRID